MEFSNDTGDLGGEYPCRTGWVVLVLSSVGLFWAMKTTVTFLNWIYAYFLRPPKNLRDYGSWAIVTGSTDGIGRAFAFRLVGEGMNLVLVGRNPERLDRVEEEIRASHHGVQIKTLLMDFSDDNLTQSILRFRKALEGLDVGILVNNAGTTYPSAMYFHEVEEETWRNVVKVNLEGLTMMTRAVLPSMMKKRRGAIVNIGSGAAAAIPSHPLFTVYAATKAYVDSFSRILHAQCKSHGIHVQCQIPMYVATKMAPFGRTSFFVLAPDRYARAAVRQIGHGSRCTPYWTHSLQWWLASMAPERVLDELRLRSGVSRRRKAEVKMPGIDD